MFEKDELDQAREMAARYMAKCERLENELEEAQNQLEDAKTGSRVLGKEAEELRAAFENLIEEDHFLDGTDCAEDVEARFIKKIQHILDNVDARDSLAYLESLEKKVG